WVRVRPLFFSQALVAEGRLRSDTAVPSALYRRIQCRHPKARLTSRFPGAGTFHDQLPSRDQRPHLHGNPVLSPELRHVARRKAIVRGIADAQLVRDLKMKDYPIIVFRRAASAASVN